MTIKYDNLIGREFKQGSQDCYGLVRDFYSQNFNIDLPNFARTTDFWMNGIDLFTPRFHKVGFRALDAHPTEYQIGDVFLMTLKSEIPNHVAILVENNRILHHFTNRLSEVEMYKGMWRNCTTAVLRHKDVNLIEEKIEQNILEILPPHVVRKINEQIQNQ